jgi:hypothetical protein
LHSGVFEGSLSFDLPTPTEVAMNRSVNRTGFVAIVTRHVRYLSSFKLISIKGNGSLWNRQFRIAYQNGKLQE